jgi:hypothetical protein
MFSYAFFFEGYTGLTITGGAVLTLFVLMQVTGRIDWATALARGPSPMRPPLEPDRSFASMNPPADGDAPRS